MGISVPPALGVPWSSFPETGQRAKRRMTRLFTASGSWTPPPGVEFVYLEMVGGGGGGFGVTAGGAGNGMAGGGGLTLRGTVIVIPGAVYTITVGAAGTGGTGGSGMTDGGDTIVAAGLTQYVARGGPKGISRALNGAGSVFGVNNDTFGPFASGGNVYGLQSSGLVATPGGRGAFNIAGSGTSALSGIIGEPCEGVPGGAEGYSSFGPGGGSTPFGQGGDGCYNSGGPWHGSAPTTANCGAGGGGGVTGTTSAANGGAGAAGFVRLIWDE